MMMTPEGMAAAMAAQQQLPTAPAGAFDQQQLQQMSAMMSMVPPFNMDPAMTQAYAQAFTSYLQQAQAYAACGVDPAAGLAAATGVPLPAMRESTPQLPQ